MSDSTELSGEQQALQRLVVRVASELNAGSLREQIAARLVQEGVLEHQTAQVLVNQIAELREKTLRREMLKADITLCARETGLFLGGFAANFAACVIASVILGVIASFGDIGEGIAMVGEEAAGIGVSAGVAYFSQEIGSLFWFIGCVVGYFAYLYWLAQG